MATGVFLGSDGAVYHQACWRPLSFRGVRGAGKAQFFCSACIDGVTLAMRDLPSLPMSHAPATSRADIEATLMAAGLPVGY